MDNRVLKDNFQGGSPPTSEKESPELKNTGERFIPGTKTSAEMAYDHLTRYRMAERYVADKIALDMGCGTGYGSRALSKVARNIVGVDLSEDAVSYAAWKHQAPNLHYEVGDVSSLPYSERIFEAIVSFEVIEHLQNPEELVMEARRLLTEEGVFVVSSPDKQTYSNERNRVNAHHLKEMYPLEFKELLERHFKNVQIYWQGALAGSLIAPDRETLPEDGILELESAQFSLTDPGFGQGTPTSLYMIAVCTNGEAPNLVQHPLAILDRDRQIYEEYDDTQHVPTRLKRQHNYELREVERQNKSRQRRINQLQEQSEKRRGRLSELEQQNRARQRRINQLQEQSEKHRGRLSELEQQNKKLRSENDELNRLSDERELIVNSRGWKIANGINVFGRKVRNILGRRAG